MLMKYRCANNANWEVNNIIFNALVLLTIMCANEIYGGTILIDPSNVLLANNCSFLQRFTISDNTNDFNCIFLYCHPRWEIATHREMAKSLDTENG